MTPSQIQLYSRMAYFRRDEEKKFKEEMAIMAAGGDAREYMKKRKTLREIATGIPVKFESLKEDGAPTSARFLEAAARMGISVKKNASEGVEGTGAVNG